MVCLLAVCNCAAAGAATNKTDRLGLGGDEVLLASGAGAGGVLPTSQPDVGPVPGAGVTAPSTGPQTESELPYLRGANGAPLLVEPKQIKAKKLKWTTDAAGEPGVTTGRELPAEQRAKNGGQHSTSTSTPPPSNRPELRNSAQPVLKSIVTENDGSLGIIDALDEALLHSPRAAAIRATLGIARSNYAYATVQRNPYFFFDRGPVAEAVRRIGPTFTWTPPWQVAFDWLVAKRQVDQAKKEILRDLWGLRADVRRAYTDAVVAQETARATRSLVDLADQTVLVSMKRFHAGATPEFDVLKARLAKEQAQLDLKQAQQRVIKTKQRLNLLLGRVPKRALVIPSLESADRLKQGDPKRNYFLPELAESVPDLDVFIAQAEKSRWELTVLGQQMTVNKAQLKNAYASIVPIPQLIIGQSVSGNQPSGPKLNAYFFTINAEMPLTNCQQGDIAKYRAIEKQLKWQMESLKNQVFTEISDAYNDLITYRDRIQLYQEHVLADSVETARLARRSYEVGFTDITSVIQAQQANFQIELQYLADVQSYQQAFIDLEQATGRPLQ